MPHIFERPFYLGEPMDLSFDGLKLRKTGAPIDNETLSYRFYLAVGDKRGDAITAIPDGTANYEAGSDGNYFVTILPTAEILANLRDGMPCYLRLWGGSGLGVTSDRTIRIRVQYRAEE